MHNLFSRLLMLDTSKLDRIFEDKHFQLELKRKYLLEKVLQWLDNNGLEYGLIE